MGALRIVIVLTTGFIFTQSCNEKPKIEKTCYSKDEIHLANIHDTVNLIDCDGKKQGLWVPNKINKLTKTTFFRNDTVINSQQDKIYK